MGNVTKEIDAKKIGTIKAVVPRTTFVALNPELERTIEKLAFTLITGVV